MASYQTDLHLWQHPKWKTWYLVWQEGGEPKRRSIRTKKYGEAQQILQAAIEQLGNKAVERKEVTLHAALDSWLSDRSRPLRALQATTLKEYRTVVKQLKSVTPAGLLAGDVRPAAIRDILDSLQSRFNLAATTVKKRFGILRMMFAWMVEEDLIDKSPVKKGDVPLAEAKQKPPWSQADYQALRMALKSESEVDSATPAVRRNLHDFRDLVDVLWLSGMRSIQAYRMRWEDVDLQRMVWVVRSPRRNKGGEKVQPIHRDLKPLLERRTLLGGTEVFPAKEKMTTIWARFKARRPEFKGWSLHQARARVVTELKRMGELQAAKDLVGHTQDETSELYTHLGVEDHREALNRLK